MNLYVFTMDGSLAPERAFAALRGRDYALWLDSADRAHDLARYSFIGWSPVETIESKNGRVSIRRGDATEHINDDPFAVLSRRLAAYGMNAADDPELPPFLCGAAGYFGYDLGRGIETLPSHAADELPLPDMAVGIYDRVLAFDHHRGNVSLLVRAADQSMADDVHADCLRALRVDNAPAFSPTPLQWQARDQEDAYRAKVQRVIDYIYAGDIFQANLSQQFFAALPDGFDPFAHYCHLRRLNPAPFAAYIDIRGGMALSSASPERFLYTRGGHVDTRPIKGTRPRHSDPAQDRALANDLSASAKDNAENAMIVDLLRNDIAKVCTDDSVEVPHLCRLESFASVHHLVSVVTGQLRDDAGAVDLLRACFPGGSITGAPKIRAMEIIEELEPVRRGPYCGAIGYIGFNGAMDTNIAIRTLVHTDGTVRFNVGGGITAESNPADEFQETLDKGRALFRSFESV